MRKLGSTAIIVPLIAGILGAGPAVSLAAEINHAREYARCLELAKSDPGDGFETALAWKAIGGGDAAEHCAALALLHSGKPEYAARRLEVLADSVRKEPAFKAKILAQAGQAWLIKGDARRAEAVFTTALGLAPGEPETLIDRAEARTALADYQGAVEDLTNAISAAPERIDAYVFRASAYRYLDNFGSAGADVEWVLRRDPVNVAALLERGILKRLGEDLAAARKDWLRILELEPDSEAARLARANIEKMDVKAK